LLRQYRLAAGLTQEGLAERAGLSVRAVQNLERGDRRPSRDTASRLADALALVGSARAEFDLAWLAEQDSMAWWMLSEAVALFRSQGLAPGLAVCALGAADLEELARKRLGDARFEVEWRIGRTLSPPQIEATLNELAGPEPLRRSAAA